MDPLELAFVPEETSRRHVASEVSSLRGYPIFHELMIQNVQSLPTLTVYEGDCTLPAESDDLAASYTSNPFPLSTPAGIANVQLRRKSADIGMTNNVSNTTETEIVPESVQRTLAEILPPYLVILHNDEDHSMEYVVESLVKSVPGLSTTEAATIMLEAHQNGQAVVITCPLEQAEHYRDRIRTFGLGVTIEKA